MQRLFRGLRCVLVLGLGLSTASLFAGSKGKDPAKIIDSGKFGIFAATYGIAAVYFSQPHTQIVVIGNDELAEQLYAVANSFCDFDKAVLKLAANEVVAQNLPPALAETLPQLPGAGKDKSMAVICSGFSCQPPISNPEQLRERLSQALRS